MSQKKYQGLQSANTAAAKIIYNKLKEKKAISHETFSVLYCRRPGGAHRSGSFNNLIKTTQDFLFDHGLMSTHIINGLIVYVATQKCFRTKNFENATKVAQLTSDDAIDRAIEYVKLNNNMVPAEFEGPIVANMLGLEGATWKYFVESYKYNEEWNSNEHCGLPIKFKVISVVMILQHEGLLKKV
jgi:hypothetical protein